MKIRQKLQHQLEKMQEELQWVVESCCKTLGPLESHWKTPTTFENHRKTQRSDLAIKKLIGSCNKPQKPVAFHWKILTTCRNPSQNKKACQMSTTNDDQVSCDQSNQQITLDC